MEEEIYKSILRKAATNARLSFAPQATHGAGDRAAQANGRGAGPGLGAKDGNKVKEQSETEEQAEMGETMAFNDLHRKKKRLCSLCENKFAPDSLTCKVTKKRIVEWRRARRITMKQTSPFTMYDYVPVCKFCAQLFTVETLTGESKNGAKRSKRKPVLNERDEGQGTTDEASRSFKPFIFALDDRTKAKPTPFFQSLFS